MIMTELEKLQEEVAQALKEFHEAQVDFDTAERAKHRAQKRLGIARAQLYAARMGVKLI